LEMLLPLCTKSIRLYFFPEKPVTAGWQIWSQLPGGGGGGGRSRRVFLWPRPGHLSIQGR
jgi:hypothetical protein